MINKLLKSVIWLDDDVDARVANIAWIQRVTGSRGAVTTDYSYRRV